MDQIKGGGTKYITRKQSGQRRITWFINLMYYFRCPPWSQPTLPPPRTSSRVFSSPKHESWACMNSHLQWVHRFLGRGVVSSRVWVFWFWLTCQFPIQQESCLLDLMRLATEANSLALVVVRSSLALTNSSRTVFSVVATVARASKYLLRSLTDLFGPFTWFLCSGSGACLSALRATQNWSWPPTAWFLTLDFWYADLYRFV